MTAQPSLQAACHTRSSVAASADVAKPNLCNYAQQDLRQLLLDLGEKPFRAQQLLQWIHRDGVTDFAQMTNLSKSLRQTLAEKSCITLPKIVFSKPSSDGTWKWLIQVPGGSCIETVFIPEPGRGTLCVSSQIGCGLKCSFCSTAQQGFNRNLSVSEIIGQIWLARDELQRSGKYDDRERIITNVVMMGMGEPLLNERHVINAMDLMMDDYAYGLSKYRVTLSTSGLVPAMQRLQKESDCALAVSLHAATDELRDVLVPINKKYPLKQLMAACRAYFPAGSKRKITFEYVMLAGVNDSAKQAQQLAKLIKDVPCKLNLIPFNPFPGTDYECSDIDTILRFQAIVKQAGICTTVRKTRGDDIDAACGQLAGDVEDLTSRTQAGRERRAKKRQDRA